MNRKQIHRTEQIFARLKCISSDLQLVGDWLPQVDRPELRQNVKEASEACFVVWEQLRNAIADEAARRRLMAEEAGEKMADALVEAEDSEP